MHSYLNLIPNRLFYNDSIKSVPTQKFKFFIHNNKPLLFVDIASHDEFVDPSFRNGNEARAIKQILKKLIFDYKYPKEWFGIITPYLG